MDIFATATIFLVCNIVVQTRSFLGDINDLPVTRQSNFVKGMLQSPEEEDTNCICIDGVECINPKRKCEFGSYVDNTCNYFMCYKGPGELCDGKNDKCGPEYTCICNMCANMMLKKKLSTFECQTSINVMAHVIRHQHGRRAYCD